MRICIVSEALKPPFDEGVKVFAYNLTREFSKFHTVLALGRSSDLTLDIRAFCFNGIPRNKLFFSLELKKEIRTFKPDIILYLPTAHATLFSFLRAKVLKYYGNQSNTILVTLQPRDYSAFSRKIMTLLMPDLILAQSQETYQAMKGFGWRTEKIMCGVDLEKFVPAGKIEKEILLKKYNIPNDKFIVLHVGHINKRRNAQFMENIQSMKGIQAVIVGSTTYPEDKDLVSRLKEKGVKVITDYIEKIQEIYQCSDCYVFPVQNQGACIEIPMSILEALACNIPVVTTRFRGLPEIISEQSGFHYVDDVTEFETKINLLMRNPHPDTREIAEKYSWKSVAQQIIEVAQTALFQFIKT